jgi:hypothetical protein
MTCPVPTQTGPGIGRFSCRDLASGIMANVVEIEQKLTPLRVILKYLIDCVGSASEVKDCRVTSSLMARARSIATAWSEEDRPSG